MGDLNWDKVETIIDEVLNLPKEKRYTYIEETCGHDQRLKSEVTQLIESIFDSEGWLEDLNDNKHEFYNDVSEDLEFLSTNQDFIGQQVGSYTIEKKIGQGGMGLVYLAKRADDNFEHQVAIKIIRQNQATETNIERFRREQRILAGLKHPGIAQLYDGGVTAESFPYIIMEYVDGISITEYCQRHNCSIEDRIALFKQVLKAVRYAHENLVIHRDLKPDNILVDQKGNIKILDFGISKILQDEDDLSLTRTGSRILTPKYAAPEQITQTNITTATDLYSLGVIFYELLAGVPPFDFSNCTTYQAEQIILKQNSPKPSTKVFDPKVKKQLQGDLDAITLKAIRKEPVHRYRMANEFLEDLKNYQKGFPVTAHEDSFRYRSQKFFKRYKQSIAIAAGVLLFLIGLTGLYTWKIAQEKNQAQLQAQRAEQVKKFMLDMFNTGNPDLKNYAGSGATVNELLMAGFHRTERELQDQPAMYIEMLSAIGDALAELDEFETSKSALSKALQQSNKYYGPDSPKSAQIRSSLAQYYHGVHKYKEAEQQILKAIQIKKKLYGKKSVKLAGDYSTYASNQFLQSKYKRAKEFFLKSDSLRQANDTDNTISYYISMANLGETELFLGEYERAEKHLKEALKFFQEFYDQSHPELARTKYRIGLLYHRTSKHKKAETYLLQSLEEFTDLYGKSSSELSANYAILARNYRVLGDWEKAEKYALKDIELTNKVYGDSSTIYAKSINNFALIQKAQGNLQKAKNNYEKSLSIYRNKMDSTNPDLAIPMYNLGDVLKDLGDYSQAKILLEEVVSIDKAQLGEKHPEVGLDLNKLGAILLEAEQFAEADSIFTEAKLIYENNFPKYHYRIGEFFMNFGKLKYRQQNYAIAQNYFSKAITVFRKNFEEENYRIQEGLEYIKKVKEKTSS